MSVNESAARFRAASPRSCLTRLQMNSGVGPRTLKRQQAQVLNRIRELSWEFWLGLLAVAAILMAIPVARPDLAKVVQVSELFYLGLDVAGACLAIAGITGLAALVLSRALARDAAWCEFRPVCRGDAKEVHELMSQAFGEESPSINRVLEWQRRNRAVMTAVYVKKLVRGKVSRRLVGVFKILPLTAEAVTLLEREQLTGANISPAFIAGPNEQPAGLYIGDVLAVSAHAKGELLRQLMTVLQAGAKAGIPLYARPLTAHGARLVRKYHFVPVTSELTPGTLGRIHRLHASVATASGAPIV